MAIVKNADGTITVGMIPEVKEEKEAEAISVASAPKKKPTTKKKQEQ